MHLYLFYHYLANAKKLKIIFQDSLLYNDQGFFNYEGDTLGKESNSNICRKTVNE